MHQYNLNIPGLCFIINIHSEQVNLLPLNLQVQWLARPHRCNTTGDWENFFKKSGKRWSSHLWPWPGSKISIFRWKSGVLFKSVATSWEGLIFVGCLTVIRFYLYIHEESPGFSSSFHSFFSPLYPHDTCIPLSNHYKIRIDFYD